MGLYRSTPLVHRAPRWDEQQTALVEIVVVPTVQDLETLEAIAEDRRERAGLPVRCPAAKLVARALGFVLFACDRNAYCSRVIYYNRGWRRGRREWAIYHELAHGVFDLNGLPHDHVDVQILAVMLAIPRWDVFTAMRAMPHREAVAWLCRKYWRVPAWIVRTRCALFLRMAKAA